MSAQQPQNWKTFWQAAAADTNMSCMDNAGISRQAYLIAYGRRDNRIPWSMAKQIDSAKDRFHNIRSTVFALPSPVPVLITYALVEAGPDSALRYHKDLYKRTKAIYP